MSNSRSIHILLVDTDPECIAAVAFFASEIKNCVLNVALSESDVLKFSAAENQTDLMIFSDDSKSITEDLFSDFLTKNPEAYSIVILPELNLELGKEYRERGAQDGVYRLENYLGNLRCAIRKALVRFTNESPDYPRFAQPFETGKRILHYEILELIGSGIRSDVYKAQDLKEDRVVAVKILPPSIANQTIIRRRLMREATAASHLQHPSFVNLIAVEDAEGIVFLVMDYLEGESLHAMLSKGTIGMFRLLGIASQLSEALNISHRAGIIHGNLKPGNIFLTPQGTAKLLDFGLPQKVPSFVPGSGLEELLQISRNGLPWDSLFYLSPEQIRGEDLDSRSDVFSLASVLYHAATGEKPFDGNDPGSILSRIQNEEPLKPSHFKPHLQGEFENILLRALEKDRAKRGASASDLYEVLSSLKSKYLPEEKEETKEEIEELPDEEIPKKRITTALLVGMSFGILLIGIFLWILLREKPLTRLAVLPLQYPEKNQALTPASTVFLDSLIEQFSAVSNLEVIQPFTSFHHFKTADPDPEGRFLKVRYVVTGKLEEGKENWELHIQLKDLKTNSVRWEQTYPAKIEKLPATLADSVSAVLKSLDLSLNQQQQKFFLSKWTSSIPALQLYLQGRRLYYDHSREELQQSIRLYDLAISNDPKFATAYSASALAYLDLAKSGSDQVNNFQKAEDSALKAIDLEVRQSEAHMVLGAVNLLYKWNFQIAEEELKNALALNPNSSVARSYLAILLTARRQPEAALKEMIDAQKRDPLSETMQLEFIQLLTKLKKYDQAIELAQANMDRFDPISVNLLLGDAYLGKKESDDALLSYRRSKDLGSNDAVAKIATVLADSGMNREAVTLLENLINRSPDNVNPDLVAAAYARIGDPAKAVEWLRKSSLERPSSLVLLRIDPAFDSLRSDPHFNQFLLKSGL